MYWIFGVKFVDLEDSCAVGGDPAMNIIFARVPVLNAPESALTCISCLTISTRVTIVVGVGTYINRYCSDPMFLETQRER